jgi:hypothetical protein
VMGVAARDDLGAEREERGGKERREDEGPRGDLSSGQSRQHDWRD